MDGQSSHGTFSIGRVNRTTCRFQKDGDGSKRTTSHVLHFNSLPFAGSPALDGLLRLPGNDRDGQEEEEAREEDGKEDKQVDPWLILPEKERTEGYFRRRV